MSHAGRTTQASHAAQTAAPRRVLIACAADDGKLRATFTAAGFEARDARDADEAALAFAEFDPEILVVSAGGATQAGARAGVEFLEFARRLRAGEAARPIPLVVLCPRGDEETRDAALDADADDCFDPSTPPREVRARLDALLWRVEAGRSAAARSDAAGALERRAEIDDFMHLLEAARAAADAGEKFSLALLAPTAPSAGGAQEEEEEEEEEGSARDAGGAPGDEGEAQAAVKAAYEFLRLNLRRADSIAFYGPTLIVALLPRRRPRDARRDLARVLAELEDARPGSPVALGLASFPGDGANVEALIERAEAELGPALHGPDAEESYARGEFRVRFRLDEEGARAQGSTTQAATTPAGPGQEFLPLESSGPSAPGEWRSEESRAGGSAADHAHAKRGLPSDFSSKRVLRESRRDEFEAPLSPYAAAAVGGQAGGGVLERAAAEAAARERERRAAGAPMPRRVLLTVSDPARMAQINLLLRSAAYEVRAAFDGGQALDLLRIERADVLVLDYGLKVLDGLEVLRRLHDRHRGQLPMPVALLLPPGDDFEPLREEARTFGATGFVQLPYDPAEFLECVRVTGSKD